MKTNSKRSKTWEDGILGLRENRTRVLSPISLYERKAMEEVNLL